MAKEDTAVIPVTLSAIALTEGAAWWPLPLVLIAAVLYAKRRFIREILRGNGDRGMMQSGFPGSLAQPEYSLTAFTESVLRYPLWAIGLNQCVDPDIRPATWPRITQAAAVAALVVAAFVLFPALRIPLILTVISPMLLYWLFPMPDPVFEYRSYVSMLGLTCLAVLVLAKLPIILTTVAVAYLFSAAAYRAFDWSSSLALWKGAVRDGADKPRVWLNLGAAYQVRNEHDEAQKCFRRALELNPNVAPAWANLGLIEAAYNRMDKAEEYFTECTVRCPTFDHGWQALAELYTKTNRPELAAACLRDMQLAKG